MTIIYTAGVLRVLRVAAFAQVLSIKHSNALKSVTFFHGLINTSGNPTTVDNANTMDYVAGAITMALLTFATEVISEMLLVCLRKS